MGMSKSKDDGIVLTSRIRLARNIDKIPFPHMMDNNQAEGVIDDVFSSITKSNSAMENEFKQIKLRDLNSLERLSMVEKHIISIDLAKNYEKAGLLINKDEDISIMINEEDHIRLQVLYPGLQLKKAYEYASKLDDLIEEDITYAFSNELGYLTSCPTNLGTGIRASVMLHLPALSITKNIGNILDTVSQIGMTIRGIYGEGSNIMGNMYQISNQVTLGLSEEEILNNLEAITKKIVDQEMKARSVLLEKQKCEFEDDIYRALGILRYSRILSSSECLNLISKVRMGIEMGIIDDIKMDTLNSLIAAIQPGTLQLKEGKKLDEKQRDMIRAGVVRETLK